MLDLQNRTILEQYEENGIVFPISVLNQRELNFFKSSYEEIEAYFDGAPDIMKLKQLHLFFSWAYDLVTHPLILDQVEQILGPNILVHSTSVFNKKPGDNLYVSWHQDGYYYELDKPQFVSAWVAFSDSSTDNGCLRVLPGTHSKQYEHREVKHNNNMLTSGLTVAEPMDESNALDVILQAGEMSLHHVNIVHGSNPNQSNRNRTGFAIRYIVPAMKQELIHHDVVLARGQDYFGNYSLLEKKPSNKTVEEGINNQQLFFKEYAERRREFFDKNPGMQGA